MPVRRHFERIFRQIGRALPVQTSEMLSFTSAGQRLAESDALGLLTCGTAQSRILRLDLRQIGIILPRPLVWIVLRLRGQAPGPAVVAFARVLPAILAG